MSQSTTWMFTLQAGEDGEDIVWRTPGIEGPLADWIQKPGFKYFIYQAELAPSTDKCHLQGYLVLKSKITLTGLKRHWSNEAHWEIRKGDHKQAKNYCSKSDTRINGPWEAGEEPAQGKRSDIKDIYTMVKAKKTDEEILEATEGAAARYEKAIKFTRFVMTKKESDRQLQGVKIITLYGPTGTGKTYAAVNFLAGKGDYYICESPSQANTKLWFDGYEGQHTLILDDFDGCYCAYRYLLRLLDCYELKVEVKGGHAWACWTTVVITTNRHPSNWYDGVDHSPLQRRLLKPGSEIRYMDTQGVYKRMDWSEHLLDDDYLSMQAAPAVVDEVVPDTPPPSVPSQDGYLTGPDTQAARQEQRQQQQIVID